VQPPPPQLPLHMPPTHSAGEQPDMPQSKTHVSPGLQVHCAGHGTTMPPPLLLELELAIPLELALEVEPELAAPPIPLELAFELALEVEFVELAIPPVPLRLDVDASLLLPPVLKRSPLPPQPSTALIAAMPDNSTAQSNDSFLVIPTSTCALGANRTQTGCARMAYRWSASPLMGVARHPERFTKMK